MKKILPLIAIIGTSFIFTGCSNNITSISALNIKENVSEFKETVQEYSGTNTENITKSYLDKYNASLDTPKTLELTENNQIMEDNEILSDSLTENEINDSENNKLLENELIENANIDETNEQISTLYSISSDIKQSSSQFEELKSEITKAIIETENLITKLHAKEIDLSREQRIFLSEQSAQLRSLGKQLSNTTTELNYYLSDIQQILSLNNQDLDTLSLKYLVVLDNLVNGNEMLQSGLTSLNMINQMFNLTSPIISPNNTGKIVYGFRRNNEQPIIKEYEISENGELIEQNSKNSDNLSTEVDKQETENTTEETKQTNTDTFSIPLLKNNIDTYKSNNPHNIDTFFNTALLDNELMYGNGANSYYGGYGFNPNLNRYSQYENYNRNVANSVDSNNTTQDVDRDGEKKGNKERKDFKLIKNVDTYKDTNAPTLKSKIAKIKTTFNKMFKK